MIADEIRVLSVHRGQARHDLYALARTSGAPVKPRHHHCPGRLLDLLGQGLVKLKIRTLVLDEGPHVYMAFVPIAKLQAASSKRQNLFSATMPKEIRTLP